MTGTSEGGKKAAETRGHESLSEAGSKGGKNSDHKQSGQTASHDSQSKGGQKGGSKSGKNNNDE